MSSYQDYLNHIILDIDNSNNLTIQYLDEDDNLIETYIIDSSHNDVTLNATSDISYDHEIDICMNASIFNCLFLFSPNVGVGHDSDELSKIEYAIDYTQWQHVDFSSLQLQNQGGQDVKTHFLYYMLQQHYGNRQDVDVTKLVKNKSALLTKIQGYDDTYNREIINHLKTMGTIMEPENNENNASNFLLRSYITISKQNSNRRLAFLKTIGDDFEKNKKKFIRLRFETGDVVSLVLVYQSSSTIQQRYKINFIIDEEENANPTYLTLPSQSTWTLSGDSFAVDDNSILDASSMAHQYTLSEGSYVVHYDDSANPITFLNHGKENMFRVYSDDDKTTTGTIALDDASYNFYWGTLYVNVYSDFNNMSVWKKTGTSFPPNGYQLLCFDSSYNRPIVDTAPNLWTNYGQTNRIYGNATERYFGRALHVNDQGNMFFASAYDASQQNQSIKQYKYDVFHESWTHGSTLVDPDASSNSSFGSTFCLYNNYLFVDNVTDNNAKLHLYQHDNSSFTLLNSLDLSVNCVDGCVAANSDLVAFCLLNGEFLIYSYSFSSFTELIRTTPFPSQYIYGMAANYTVMDRFLFIDQSYNIKSYDFSSSSSSLPYNDASFVEDTSSAIANPFSANEDWNEPPHSRHISMSSSGLLCAIGYPNYQDHRGIVHMHVRNNSLWEFDLSLNGSDNSYNFYGNLVKLHNNGELVCVANGSLTFAYDGNTHAYSTLDTFVKEETAWKLFGEKIRFYENPRHNIVSRLSLNQNGNVMVYSDHNYTYSNDYVYDASSSLLYKHVTDQADISNGLVTCVIQTHNPLFHQSYENFDASYDISFRDFFGITNFGHNSFIYPHKTLIRDGVYTPYIGSNVIITPMGTKMFANHAIVNGVSGDNRPLYCYKYYYELDTWYPHAHYDISSNSNTFVHYDICDNYIPLYNGIVHDSACRHESSALACSFSGNQIIAYQDVSSGTNEAQYMSYKQEIRDFSWSIEQIIETNDTSSNGNIYLSLDGDYAIKKESDSSMCFYEDLSLAWTEPLSTFYNASTHDQLKWNPSKDFSRLWISADGLGTTTAGFVSCFEICFNEKTVTQTKTIDSSFSVVNLFESPAVDFQGNIVAFAAKDNSNNCLVYVYRKDAGQWSTHGDVIYYCGDVSDSLRIQGQFNYTGSMLTISQVNTTTNSGKISMYTYHSELDQWTLYYQTGETVVQTTNKSNIINAVISSHTNARWGYSLSTNYNGQIFALGAPYFSHNETADSQCGVIGVFQFI